MPPPRVQHGASAIHSAEERAAPDTFSLFVYDLPVDSLVIVTENSLLLWL